MKKHSCFLMALICALLFAASFSACAPQADKSAETQVASASEIPTASAATTTATVSVPEEMQAFIDDPRTNFLVNLYAQLPGTILEQSERTDVGALEFPYAGGELVWNVHVMNGLPDAMRTGFMVLCDGVPTEFTLVETGEKTMHLSVDLEGEQVFKIAFTPNFASGIGKIDFVPFGGEHLSVVWGSAFSFPVFAVLPDNYQPASSVPESTAYNTPIRPAIDGSVGGYLIETSIQDTDTFEELQGGLGAQAFDLSDATDCIFEFVAGQPGRYRLTALLDFEPFAFFDGKSTIDCTLTEGEMLSFTRPVNHFIPNGTHSFTILAMRLDGDPFADELQSTSRHELKR